MIIRILLFLLKNLLIIMLFALALGRLFFPKTVEDTVINPVRRMPVFGQVLGTTWDKAGDIGPALTDNTTQLADQVETSDLPIDETISSIATSDDPRKAATSLVDKTIDDSMKKFENLPAAAVEEIKKEIRKEMYKQICQDWLGNDLISSPSPQVR